MNVRVDKTRRVFLCHNSSDKALVESAALAMLKAGAVRTWLDTWEIRGGEDWKEHIRREFAESWSCIVFAGPHGLGPFQRHEIGWAAKRSELDPDYLVLPVILPGAGAQTMDELAQVLPGIQWISLQSGWKEPAALTPLLRALRGDRPGPPAFAVSVAVAAEHWDAGGRRDRSTLLRGKGLEAARTLLTEPDAFDPLSLAFITASAGEEQRRNRRTIALLSGLAIVLVAVALWANRQRLAAESAQAAEAGARSKEAEQRAEAERQRDTASAAQRAERKARDDEAEQRRLAEERRNEALTQRDLADRRRDIAESRAWAAEARRLVPVELVAALARGAEAYERSPTSEAWTALLEGLNRASHMKVVRRCQKGQKATGAALSPGRGSVLAYACMDRTTTWLSVVGEKEEPIAARAVLGDARAFVFLDERRLVYSSKSGVALLDLDQLSRQDSIFDRTAATVMANAPSLSGFFAASAAGEIRLWQTENGAGKWGSRLVRAANRRFVQELLWRDDQLLEVRESGGDVTLLRADGMEVVGIARSGPNEQGVIDAKRCTGSFPRPSVRYFANATTPTGRAFGYATEGNEVVVARLGPQGCFEATAMPGHTHNILRLVVSDDGTRALSAGAIVDADDGHGIVLWDLTQVHPIATSERSATQQVRADAAAGTSQPGGAARPDCVAFAPDGAKVLVREEKGFLVFQDRLVGSPFRLPLPQEAGSCAGLAYSASAHVAVRLANEYEPMLIVQPSATSRGGYELQSWPNPLKAPSGLRTTLRQPRLSPNGQLLAAISNETEVGLFDIGERHLVGSIETGSVRLLTMAEDGRYLITDGSKGPLRWEINPQAMLVRARDLSARSLPTMGEASRPAIHKPGE